MSSFSSPFFVVKYQVASLKGSFSMEQFRGGFDPRFAAADAKKAILNA